MDTHKFPRRVKHKHLNQKFVELIGSATFSGRENIKCRLSSQSLAMFKAVSELAL